jgi:drug/metabolite transporter (DMT)-like permease
VIADRKAATSSPRADDDGRSGRSAWLDGLLVLMVLIWGANYSAIKLAFSEVPEQSFNALRLLIASGVFLSAIAWARRRAQAPGPPLPTIFHTASPVTRRDRLDLLWLGFVGHFIYQFCFVGGVAATSVSNAALIIGATPAVVAILSALIGRERIGRLHWAGAAVSLVGIYLVIGRDASFGGSTITGDLQIIVSVICWSVYTLGTGRLIRRHSPLYVTGMTMAIGGIPYAIAMMPHVLAMRWTTVSWWVWVTLVLSALLALCVAYVIWYTAVQRIGAARTAIYSNVVPLVAMACAALWLHESITAAKLAGAAAVLTGVVLTRLGRKTPAVPIEE